MNYASVLIISDMNDHNASERFRVQLQDMLVRQRKHNEHVHERWDEQNYPFCRAIWMECAELIEHFGWKWWKQQTQDMDQVHLEIVDIWHFGLSQTIVTETSEDQIVRAIFKGIGSDTPKSFVIAAEELARSALRDEFDLIAFGRLLNSANMSLDLLYAFYIGKNTLNIFRQLNGYKEGSYEKYWRDQREDNYFLVEVLMKLQHQETITEQQILSELASLYPKRAITEPI